MGLVVSGKTNHLYRCQGDYMLVGDLINVNAPKREERAADLNKSDFASCFGQSHQRSSRQRQIESRCVLRSGLPVTANAWSMSLKNDRHHDLYLHDADSKPAP